MNCSTSCESDAKSTGDLQSKGDSVGQVDDSSSYMHCDFMDVRFHLEKAFDTGKTVLIIDTSEDEKVCTYMSYQPDHCILEAKSMIQKYSSQSLLSAMEFGRKYLVNAMKHGKTLVVRMGTSAPDFRGTYHDPRLRQVLAAQHEDAKLKATRAAKLKTKNTLSATPESEPGVKDLPAPQEIYQHFFPKEVLVAGGRLLRDPVKESKGQRVHSDSKSSSGDDNSGSHNERREFTWAEKLFREEDSFPHKNVAYCRDEFRVCLVSQLPVESIDEYLFGSEWGGLPSKELFQVLVVNTADEVDSDDSS